MARREYVRLDPHAPALVRLQYPKLQKGKHFVRATIDDPSYDGRVIGVAYGNVTAWVYDRHLMHLSDL